jgi:hypothetical protein
MANPNNRKPRATTNTTPVKRTKPKLAGAKKAKPTTAPPPSEKELAQGIGAKTIPELYHHYTGICSGKNTEPITEEAFTKIIEEEKEYLANGYLYSLSNI